MHKTFFLLERSKQYDLATITLCALLENRVYFRDRGHWWVRLAQNLKHLKMKGEVFVAMTYASKDDYLVGEKLNSILKFRQMMYIHMMNEPK